jgi:hypothetical protein
MAQGAARILGGRARLSLERLVKSGKWGSYEQKRPLSAALCAKNGTFLLFCVQSQNGKGTQAKAARALGGHQFLSRSPGKIWEMGKL